MGRFFACAGLGVFLTLCASGLAVFAHISQISANIVPRNIRMVTVDTSGVGAALGVGDAIYGTGERTSANSGLREYYEWGLWTYCLKDSLGGVPDACDGNSWAYAFEPVPAILYDVPSDLQSQVTSRLPSSTFTSSDYLRSYSKGAFYVLFIGTVAGGLALILGFLAHRFAFLLAALFCVFAFLCEAVGCIIWTVIISRTKNSINDAGVGITVSYGNALWLYWASTGALFLAIIPYIVGCIAGRDSYY